MSPAEATISGQQLEVGVKVDNIEKGKRVNIKDANTLVIYYIYE